MRLKMHEGFSACCNTLQLLPQQWCSCCHGNRGACCCHMITVVVLRTKQDRCIKICACLCVCTGAQVSLSTLARTHVGLWVPSQDILRIKNLIFDILQDLYALTRAFSGSMVENKKCQVFKYNGISSSEPLKHSATP